MSTYYDISDGYYWADSFCSMYFNARTKEWQKKLTKECLYKNKKVAQDDAVYFVSQEDLHLRPYLPYALAA